MDSLEVNKICAAVLTAGICFMGATLLADGLVAPHLLSKTAVDVQGVEAAPAPAAAADEPPKPIGPFLAVADPVAGEADAKVCSACHNFNEGGAAKVGPDLYGVVGRPAASAPGFSYSDALATKSGHKPWTYEELNEWLLKPAAYAPGTKMGFAGIASEKQRADVIDYLHTLSHNPEPLPAASAAPAAAQSGNSNAGNGSPPQAPGAASPGSAAQGGGSAGAPKAPTPAKSSP